MAEEEIREACLRLLAVRPRSRTELAQRLRRKGYESAQVNPVLDRLAEVELIDDAVFANAWVQSRHSFSGKGRRALAAELRLKGVEDSIAAAALEQVDASSEEQRARALVRKRLRCLPTSGSAGDATASVRKLAALLARRGYSQELAFRVVREELAAAGVDVEEPFSPGP